MSSPRTLLVVNPAAGAGRAGRVLSRVLEELKPWGEFEISVTRPGEDRPAQRIVREAVANGVTRIAVLGGYGPASQAPNGRPLYTADAADEHRGVNFGGRCTIKKSIVANSLRLSSVNEQL